ncbi:MAG: hypothetical protein M5R36_14080 [Deltaproteobacteria bacterium]|nr:hypothetical protein [Deltaproteobacteria bacterium]
MNESSLHGRRRIALSFGLAAALFFLGPFRLFEFSAWDFEALISNLSWDFNPYADEGWYANPDWIPWGRALILYAGAPLLIFALARFFGGFLEKGPPILARLPRRWKIVLAVPSSILYAGFAFAQAYAIPIPLSVEAFWWIEWYDHVAPAMEWIRTESPFLLFPGLLAAGVWLVYYAFRTMPADGKASRAAEGLRTAFSVVALPFLLLIAVVAIVTGPRAVRLFAEGGLSAFENKCFGCHAESLPLYLIKTPAEWRRTMATHRDIENLALTEDEENEITDFLLAMRSYSDKETFQTRCLRCHLTDFVRWEDRTPDDWAAVTARLAQWSPYYYRRDVREQVVAYLSRTRSDQPSTFGLDDKTYADFMRVGSACSSCHGVSLQAERYRNADQAEILDMVRRMNVKFADPFPDEKLEDVAATYRGLIQDPVLLKELFPHDQPVEGSVLPW